MCLKNLTDILKLLKFFNQDDMKREFCPLSEVDRDWGMGFKYTFYIFLPNKIIKFVYKNIWKNGKYHLQLKSRYVNPSPNDTELVRHMDLVQIVENVKDYVVTSEFIYEINVT